MYAYLKRETPPYLHNLSEQWPDVIACIQKVDAQVMAEGVLLAQMAILAGGSPISTFYHVCMDGFAYGWDISCGQKPTDTLILKYSPDLVVMSYAAIKHVKSSIESFGVEGLLISLEMSAILRGYFAALEQLIQGGT